MSQGSGGKSGGSQGGDYSQYMDYSKYMSQGSGGKSGGSQGGDYSQYMDYSKYMSQGSGSKSSDSSLVAPVSKEAKSQEANATPEAEPISDPDAAIEIATFSTADPKLQIALILLTVALSSVGIAVKVRAQKFSRQHAVLERLLVLEP